MSAPDPDVFAVAFMIRATMKELARMQNPGDPDRELERMGDEILRAIRNAMFTEEAGDRQEELREAIFQAAMHLLPRGSRRVQ